MTTPTPPAATPALRADTLELINAEITASLTRAADASARIDSKAIVIVGYAGAAASFLATRHPQPVLAALAYAAYAACAGCGIWAYAVATYTDAPEPQQLFNTYWDQAPPAILAALAATRAQAFRANAAKRQRKARRWWLSLTALTAGIILMILAITIGHT